ncbi:hypothetical protein ACOACO_03525 [Nocardioides sp. CPCC 205120]|uniref:hypothetical protein n=1 Tax=Nocardioides sp. CPCC 205120 TaxID=3406462 RepID=UPI003B510238
MSDEPPWEMRQVKRKPGARSYALQVLVFVCVVVPAARRLGDNDARGVGARIDQALLVVGLCGVVGMLVMVVVSLRAGRRGWVHDVSEPPG